MRIFDTHSHYDDEAFDEDRDALLGELLAAGGVEYVVNMGASIEGAIASAELAEKYTGRSTRGDGESAREGGGNPHADGESVREGGGNLHVDGESAREGGENPHVDGESAREGGGNPHADGENAPAGCRVFAGCGIHPDDTGVFEGEETSSGMRFAGADAVMQRLRDLCLSERCVCVGEIGLDYHWMVEPKEVQQRWFREQMNLAYELQLPINVHSREAAQDTFDLIRENYDEGRYTGGIIHCYSGSPELAREYVKMGYHIGIGGVVTFKNAKALKRVVAEVPMEYLVTETDCPYLSPEPNRGKRNDSRNIRYVIEAIARLKGMDMEECARILFDNARKLYRV